MGIRFIACILLLTAVGCGPQITRQTRFDWKPYNAQENRQSKNGVTVENKQVTELPSTFFAQAQRCDRKGKPMTNRKGEPLLGKITFHQPGQMWFKVAITNDTGHIIRLNRTVTRFFDPAGNQYEPLSKDELVSEFMNQAASCPPVAQATNNFKLIKILGRNLEILPRTTTTGWVAFRPASLEVPGTWKLSIYEMPVATDEAGTVTKTTSFDIRMVVKKYIDTYRSKDAFSRPKLVSSKEITD